MKTPILDSRGQAEIGAELRGLAGAYVPEWQWTEGTEDPGRALGELFVEMFSQTVERYNGIPQKLYTEYLNQLGVRVPPETAASGLVRFEVHSGVQEGVLVPAGSMVYAEDESNEQVVYETERSIVATPAELTGVYYADGRVIQALEAGQGQSFFEPVEGENLQSHQFAVSQGEVLRLKGGCEIEVAVACGAGFLDERLAEELSDQGKAVWYWRGASGLERFDEVEQRGSRVVLRKHGPERLEADEAGRVCLYCELECGSGRIEAEGVLLQSRPLTAQPADSLSHNDIPITGEGGYCFGRMPAPYEVFYIRSDTAMSKRGAEVCLHLELESVVYSQVETGPQYAFNRYIIDKKDAVSVQPDDVFVREVVWEYPNGRGWAALKAKGDENPFSGTSGPKEIRFTVPDDMSMARVNAEEGWYIRARVVGVENSLSSSPRWILPFVRGVTCKWEYMESRAADWLWSKNNGNEAELRETAGMGRLGFPLYEQEDERRRYMYLCFDQPLEGLPVSLMYEVLGGSGREEKLLYEGWIGGRFQAVHAMDGTGGLSHTGAVYLYIGERLERTRRYGREGYWLRMSRAVEGDGADVGAVVGRIMLNVTRAIQRRRLPEQRFTTQTYEANKQIRLLERPVMWCEVWVDEAGSITRRELERLPADEVREEWEGDKLTGCLVRWHEVERLTRYGGDARVYELDRHSGRLRFGDGRHGRVPPAGFENIVVHSAYGGGSRGNCEAGKVRQFLVSIPRISGVENVTPMGGGTDEMESERLERLGCRRIRHRGRGVGVRDLEELVLEEFVQVTQVKCFSGMDETGASRSGHLCVVVMGRDLVDEWSSRELCERVKEYLSDRCDCALVADGRLHVRPSTELKVSVEVRVEVRDLERGAETQQELLTALTELIEERWRSREIGEQIRLEELYGAVKKVPNVGSIVRVSAEGTWYEGGRQRVCPIEGESRFPFATVRSGEHVVRIEG